jgi:hypothetical protein
MWERRGRRLGGSWVGGPRTLGQCRPNMRHLEVLVKPEQGHPSAPVRQAGSEAGHRTADDRAPYTASCSVHTRWYTHSNTTRTAPQHQCRRRTSAEPRRRRMSRRMWLETAAPQIKCISTQAGSTHVDRTQPIESTHTRFHRPSHAQCLAHKISHNNNHNRKGHSAAPRYGVSRRSPDANHGVDTVACRACGSNTVCSTAPHTV